MHTVKTLSVHSLLPSLLPTTGSQKLEDEALFEAVVKRLFGTLGNKQVKISEVDKVRWIQSKLQLNTNLLTHFKNN